MKRFISILLAVLMVLGSTCAAFAALPSGDGTGDETEDTAVRKDVSYSYKTATLQGYVGSELNPYDAYGLRLRYKMPNYLGTLQAELNTTEGTAQSEVVVLYVPGDKWDGDCYYSGITATIRNMGFYHFFTGTETIIAWKDLYSYGFVPVSGGAYVYDQDALQMNFLAGPGVYTAYATVPFSAVDTGTGSYADAMASDPDSVFMTALGFPFVLILDDDMITFFMEHGVLETASSYTWPGLAELLAETRYELSGSSEHCGLQNFVDKETYYAGKLRDLIGDSSWYVPYIEKVYSLGLMSGYSDNCFKPGGNVTLAEVITIAAKICDTYNGGNGIFTGGSVWYAPYVSYAVRKGIIREGDFDTFTRQATRGEIAYILSGVLPEDEYACIAKLGPVKDLKPEDTYYDSIVKLYKAGIVCGNSDDTFGAGRNVTRAELAAIIVKLIDPMKRSSQQ